MKNICCLLVLLVLLSSCAAKPGITENVVVTLGDSERFSKDELEAAADCVIEFFSDFSGCDLLTITYDEDYSDFWAKSYDNHDFENVVVLLSDFYVDGSGADNGFNPDSTYTDWNWYLEKDPNDNSWEIFTYGYE